MENRFRDARLLSASGRDNGTSSMHALNPALRAAFNMSLPFLGLMTFILLWELVVWIWRPPDYLLPSFLTVAIRIASDWNSLAANAWITGYEVVLSFLAASVAGVLGAAALHFYPRSGKILLPVLIFVQITPQISIAPILFLWLGLGLLPKIVIAVLISFLPILINSYIGFRSLDADVLDLARSMHVGRWRLFTHFELPSALPHMFVGAKIAMTYAVVGAVVAEFMASNAGLGYVIMVANGLLDGALGLASLIVLSIEGLLLYVVLSVIERLLTPWQIAQRRAQPAIAAR
jgi:NitT/TauT family transport system permease protein